MSNARAIGTFEIIDAIERCVEHTHVPKGAEKFVKLLYPGFGRLSKILRNPKNRNGFQPLLCFLRNNSFHHWLIVVDFDAQQFAIFDSSPGRQSCRVRLDAEELELLHSFKLLDFTPSDQFIQPEDSLFCGYVVIVTIKLLAERFLKRMYSDKPKTSLFGSMGVSYTSIRNLNSMIALVDTQKNHGTVIFLKKITEFFCTHFHIKQCPPVYVATIKEPWASCALDGVKDCENR